MRSYIVVSFLFIIFIFSSCDTRRPIKDYPTTWVKIHVDWNPSKLKPYGATYCIYDIADRQKAMIFHSHSAVDSVRLRTGDYACMVFNETSTSHQGIVFSGLDHFDTAQANLDIPADQDSCVATITPDILAVGSVSSFTVTEADITDAHTCSVTVTPRRVTIPVYCTLKVTGVHNASHSNRYIKASGFSSGIHMASQEIIHEPVYLQVCLTERTYEPNGEDGTLSGTGNSFGFSEDIYTSRNTQPYTIAVDLQLRNGGTLPEELIDVSQCISVLDRTLSDDDWEAWDVENTATKVYYDRHSPIAPSIEYGIFITPDIILDLPDVPDKESPGPGFGADVDGWGDPINVPVELN